VGEEAPLTLPYSKVMANVSHLFWQSSWPQEQRIWLGASDLRAADVRRFQRRS
jgi:hypothetical protein